MRIIVFFMVLFFVADVAGAEKLELKNGKSVLGRIREETDQYIKIDFEGVTLTYYRDEINRVIRNEKPPEPKPTEVSSKPIVTSNPDLRGTRGVIVEAASGEDNIWGISLNEPIELNFKSKEEILELRKKYVDQYAHLKPDYAPSPEVFGAMESNKPWWGLKGQFCNGSGENSSEGLAEESRFLINPFLLLGVDEGKGFSISGNCTPVYPVAKKLVWLAQEQKGVVHYDLTGFFKEKENLGFKRQEITFILENSNARDFGYLYVYADEKSLNVLPTEGSRAFKEACPLKAMIHAGPGCGIPGGCNNVSPVQPELQFKVDALPATLYCKLWRQAPRAPADDADFTFVINFE